MLNFFTETFVLFCLFLHSAKNNGKNPIILESGFPSGQNPKLDDLSPSVLGISFPLPAALEWEWFVLLGASVGSCDGAQPWHCSSLCIFLKPPSHRWRTQPRAPYKWQQGCGQYLTSTLWSRDYLYFRDGKMEAHQSQVTCFLAHRLQPARSVWLPSLLIIGVFSVSQVFFFLPCHQFKKSCNPVCTYICAHIHVAEINDLKQQLPSLCVRLLYSNLHSIKKWWS